jgi:photosystem II stability/assembly factor-like uncharacterized protein
MMPSESRLIFARRIAALALVLVLLSAVVGTVRAVRSPIPSELALTGHAAAVPGSQNAQPGNRGDSKVSPSAVAGSLRASLASTNEPSFEIRNPYQTILNATEFHSQQGTERVSPSIPAAIRIGQEPERPEDDARVIQDRIRWFKERHPEIAPAQRLKTIREDYQQREAEKARFAAGAQSPEAANWVSIGPLNGRGRISSIAVHPTVPGTVYVGADGGGVWKTTDGGKTWTNLTDSINNLNVGAIALAPSSPNIVYVGTGSEHASGIGLLKSTDGGITWQFPSSVIAFRFFRISVNPTNPLELVAGTDAGGLRSTDGGNSWTTVISGAEYFEVNDIKRDPSNPAVLYAAARINSGDSRVLKSTNGGASFDEKLVGLPTNADVASLAIAPSNPQLLYLLTAVQETSHIYKSTDGGETWADLPGVSGDPRSFVSRVLGNSSAHNNAIVVSPSNPNIVIAAGVTHIRSTDAGATWDLPEFAGSPASCGYPGVHPDTTSLEYQGSTLFIAGDGGVFSTPDNGQTARELNSGLVIREHYSMWNDPVFLHRAIAGAQDNGTERRSGTGDIWEPVYLGDGFDCPINPLSPGTGYYTSQYEGILRDRQAGSFDTCSFDPALEDISPDFPDGEDRQFFTTLTIDLSNPSTLYTTSRLRIWKTTDEGNSWAPLSTTTTDGSVWNMSPLAKLAVARNNSNVLMTSSGFRSTDGGQTWTRKAPAAGLASVEIDPRDPNVAYMGSFTPCPGCSGVFMTTDGGTNWIPRGSGLPDGAVLVVRVDPLDSNILYCGTYNGVYNSTDRGQSWSRLGSGLPSIYVEDLRITDDGSVLRAATYGRGVWEYQLRPTTAGSISGRVTDNNGNALSGAILSLSVDGSMIARIESDNGGNYAFPTLAPGRNYSVRALKLQYIFAPSGVSFNNLNSNQTANFTGTFTSAAFTIGGKATAPNGNPISGILVLLGGTPYGSSRSGAITDGNGNYAFPNLAAGGDYNVQPDNFTFPPSNSKYVFTPPIFTYESLNSSQTANFIASDSFAPAATAATDVSMNSFTANWKSVNGATGYRLDVFLSNDFRSYFAGYQDLDVGNVSSRVVSGLGAGATYYYRVRAYNASVTSSNSGSVSVTTVRSTEPARIQLSSSSYDINERSQALKIEVTRGGDGSGDARVRLATSDPGGAQSCNAAGGLASSRCDYISNFAVVHFAPGEVSKTISILIVDDSYAEGDETLRVTLTDPVGAILGQASATITIKDNDSSTEVNPIDQAGYFVTETYFDFLNRQPDPPGLEFWTREITSCGSDAGCIEVKRINVSAAAFLSIEFQATGYLIERLYKVAYGDAIGSSTLGGPHALAVPIVRLNEFLPDAQEIGRDVVVGALGWQQAIETNTVAFTTTFVQRSRFTSAHPTSLTPAQFVDALFANAGVSPSPGERSSAIDEFGVALNTVDVAARARALRRVAENSTLSANESNRAFVLMEYFGYLRRNPNDPQDADYTGFDFWLAKLNQFNGNFINAEMVKAFITSIEYRQRFGP